MSSCLTHLQSEMRCDENCEDYDKNCVLRNHLQNPYCYYKKRKQTKKKEA